MTAKCESCRRSLNGRNGNGYMPCNCKTKSKIDNTDLNNLLQKAIEAKPEFVPAPEPIKIETRSKDRTSFWGKWFK